MKSNLKPTRAAKLLWNGDAWYIRYPNEDGRPMRLKLNCAEYADAFEEANRKLPIDSDWIIA
jgi:hypothetical protein